MVEPHGLAGCGSKRAWALGDEIRGIAGLDAGGQAAQVGDRFDFGRQLPIDRDALVEFEIRLRKQRDGSASRRNGGPRDHGVTAAFRQPIEDAVEVVAGVAHRLQGQPELGADCPH
jgi:hypothetical protein